MCTRGSGENHTFDLRCDKSDASLLLYEAHVTLTFAFIPLPLCFLYPSLSSSLSETRQ